MNSGALQASHRSEEENGTYDNIPTKIAGKCGFYSSTTCQCVLKYIHLLIHSMVNYFQRVG